MISKSVKRFLKRSDVQSRKARAAAHEGGKTIMGMNFMNSSRVQTIHTEKTPAANPKGDKHLKSVCFIMCHNIPWEQTARGKYQKQSRSIQLKTFTLQKGRYVLTICKVKKRPGQAAQ